MWIHNNTNIHKSVSVVARKPPMSYLRVVIRQDVKSHNFERERKEIHQILSCVMQMPCNRWVCVCWLTVWIQTALKLQGQLVGVIAANPGFVSAWGEQIIKTCTKGEGTAWQLTPLSLLKKGNFGETLSTTWSHLRPGWTDHPWTL